MRNLTLILLIVAFCSVSVFAQKTVEKKKATDADKVAVFDDDGEIKRGAMIGDSQVVALADVLANPSEYSGESVTVKGFIVRSCKKEGCWAELGAEKDSKKTIRVTMKDHQFFIPLKSAGFKAVAEGSFKVETLSKEKVKHLLEDDGATFDNINEDGSVTEISFVATGIVLTKK
ncbi:MAG: DUF4920 domain-containing protein [Pyrinomonadaceae bacterium]|nr:DUF4920 domain-containing protein [Pyrinomonadaceae bacterium]